jgi:hypothetical protein
MDIVKYWQDQVTEWDNNQAKGFDWVFGAPLIESLANKYQTPEGKKNAVHVFLTDLRINVSSSYSRTDFLNGVSESYNMSLYVMKHDNVGRNSYNEILGHPIDDSRWVQILQPLKEHLVDNQETLLSFCGKLGYKVNVTSWSMSPELLWQDNNFTGWRVNVGFQIKQ